jgi:enoyl-CoA hydratase
MSVDQEFLVDRRGRVLVMTINRPDAKNAINSAVTAGMAQALALLDSDPGLTVGVITGVGGTFCAGMDLKEFAASGPPKGLTRLLRTGCAKPLVAAIEGAALGGGLELALICDLIVAAEGASLGLPEPSRGLFAAGGGLLRLPRRIAPGLAAELVLTARTMTAEQLRSTGLLNRVTATGAALEEAVALADEIARNAPLAVAASSRLIRLAVSLDDDSYWDSQRPLAAEVFGSADAKEGPRAFVERRVANWSGA